MSQKTLTCRLCNGEATYVFSKKFIHKYDVSLFRCNQCKSLQTEEPYWLDEAYADPRPVRDVWMVERNQRLQALVYLTTKIFGFSNDKILDWGGGNGLLVRMLRDVGLDAYLLDKYATNYYAVGFEDNPSQEYSTITAFEVWEHLPHPRSTFEEIFQRQPKIHLISTSLYSNQDDNWFYILPNSGQHIFFYSSRAIQWVANHFDYGVIVRDGFCLFYQKQLKFNQQLMNFLLGQKRQHLNQIIFSILANHNFTDGDFQKLQDRGLI